MTAELWFLLLLAIAGTFHSKWEKWKENKNLHTAESFQLAKRKK